MNFRHDINGLRAIAVLAVVIFHFNPNLLKGGFAGVDVFFVISGFLMTSIIFRGVERNDFSLVKFYLARANRIIPALAFLCFVMLIFGWFFLSPEDYKLLGKHTASSVLFVSNIIFYSESGYFDASSHEKWLLHTWSLSVEWQFYVLYPIVILILRKLICLNKLKYFLALITLFLFGTNLYITSKWPDAAYYLLPSRAWEMLVGSIAFVFTLNLSEKIKRITELVGLVTILISYCLISSENAWPGYFAIFPTLGAYMIIATNSHGSILAKSIILQAIGRWSYSIYLWHWPTALIGYYFEIDNWILYGVPLSIILGIVSYKLIEKRPVDLHVSLLSFFRIQSLQFAITVFSLSALVYFFKGFERRLPTDAAYVFENIDSSPYRDECHINNYRSPVTSCEYFPGKIQWATFGDSHTVEIAYALAEKLKRYNVGIKHLSFTGCAPSYGFDDSYSTCSRWYNDSIEYIISNTDIQYVVYAHRYSSALIDDRGILYPKVGNLVNNYKDTLKSIDETIRILAKNKKKVYVYYPIPEIKKSINSILSMSLVRGKGIENIQGSTRFFYEEKNKVIINFFNENQYPPNVIFIEPAKKFCNLTTCFATAGDIPLYFDNNHPSIEGARILVSDILVE